MVLYFWDGTSPFQSLSLPHKSHIAKDVRRYFALAGTEYACSAPRLMKDQTIAYWRAPCNDLLKKEQFHSNVQEGEW